MKTGENTKFLDYSWSDLRNLKMFKSQKCKYLFSFGDLEGAIIHPTNGHKICNFLKSNWMKYVVLGCAESKIPNLNTDFKKRHC